MVKKTRIMMISTHGYVEPEPEFGMPDTGGQVVYVLELSRCLARLGYQVDILTRQLENKPQTETHTVEFINNDSISANQVLLTEGTFLAETSHGELRCPLEKVQNIVFATTGQETPRRNNPSSLQPEIQSGIRLHAYPV